ncbi:MAG: tripartite tricarboxylate transporter substrate binding protein [Burkholderiales bacterium]
MRVLIAALGALWCFLQTASAQDFAPKQITVIVGFPPGGGTDFFARIFAQQLAAALNTSVIVENRSGVAGALGTGLVVRAVPNGQTLLFTPSNLAMTQAISRNLPFDVRKDLVPVTMTGKIAFVLAIHPALPTRNVKEFIALAKARPGVLDYGSSGPGSPPHFAAELLKFRAGIDIRHIPYKGAGQIITSLLSGEVQASFLIPPVAGQHMQSGKLRGLAVSTPRRSPAVPQLPTLRESGVPGYDVTQWHGFFAPVKTPPAIVQRLHGEIVKSLAAPAVRQRLEAEGAEPAGLGSAEFSAFLTEEIRVWSDLARRIALSSD